MGALAQYLRFSGAEVSGSDRSFDKGGEKEKRAYFEKQGIRITPQDGSGLMPRHAALVVSTAIEEGNPEIRRARELSLPVLHRSELLARVCASKKTLAVAGTSGKSTVAGMIYHVLEAGGFGPSLIAGANLISLRDQGLLGNAAAGKGEWLVAETDESDGSLTRYRPELALLLNIEKDHKEIEALIPLFQVFRGNSRRAVLNGDDPRCLALAREGDMLFGGEAAAGISASAPEYGEWNSRFTLDGVRFQVHAPGRHNVENALAAVASGLALGIPLSTCAEGIGRFRGVERRFAKVGEARGITVVDDFAHNPSKVRAALETAKGRALGKNRRVLAVFHPHGFAPMKLTGRDIMEAMAGVLDAGDRVFLTDIYYAGGAADKSITSADLIAHLNARKPVGAYFPSKAEAAAAVAAEARPGDFVISMGARDPALGGFARRLLAEIAAQEVE
jgi:UDP-N-acetylmuramate--alanine ligase